MACINPDGSLTPSALAVLRALGIPATPAEIAQRAGLPLFRVRGSLRELVEAGLLAEQEGIYSLTPQGREKINT